MAFDVVVRAVASGAFSPEEAIQLDAGPESIVDIDFIRYSSDYDIEPPAVLTVHARGAAGSLDEALIRLGNSGMTNLAAITFAGNTTFLEPHLVTAYEARPDSPFKSVGRLTHEASPVARRTVDVDRTAAVVTAIDRHDETPRLRRAIENYVEALRRITPSSTLHSALHIFIAAECLAEVITRRLMSESGIESKSAYARVRGIGPRRGASEPNLDDLRAAIRKEEIFDGDEDTHNRLRDARHGIEHGFMEIGRAREMANSAFEAAADYVRRAILAELELDDATITALTTGIYARPLPLWSTRAIAEGVLDAPAFDFDRPIDFEMSGAAALRDYEHERHLTPADMTLRLTAKHGLSHQVHRWGLASPGELLIEPPDERRGH